MDANGIRFLLHAASKAGLQHDGKVMEFGAQDIPSGTDAALLRQFIAQVGGRDTSAVEHQIAEIAAGAPARRLYELAGLRYTCLDTSGEHGALELDLNFDSVPWSHKRRYSLVTNFGTTEHVVNQLNAFRVMHDLTAARGIMIHALPSQGFLSHGLVNYPPKFFWRLAEFNSYELISMKLIADSGDYRVPDSLAQTCEEFDASLELRDIVIFVCMRKSRDTDFVPPFDGAIQSSRLARRYPADLVQKYNRIFGL